MVDGVKWDDSDPEALRAYYAAYRKKNRERLRAYHAEWTRNNPDKMAASRNRNKVSKAVADRVYADANADKIQEYQAAYRAAHKEESKEYRAGHYAKNKARYYQRSLRWRAEHPEEWAAYQATYKLTPRGRASQRAYGHNRRVKAGTKLKAATVLRVMAEYGGICPYCNTRIQGRGHIDHIVPIASGGDNSRENLVYVCAECNIRKGAKSLIVFLLEQVPW